MNMTFTHQKSAVCNGGSGSLCFDSGASTEAERGLLRACGVVLTEKTVLEQRKGSGLWQFHKFHMTIVRTISRTEELDAQLSGVGSRL